MKKLFSVFTITIIFLSVTCVVFLYQNSSLNNQIGVLEDNLSECQSRSVQCENQINELESQIDEREEQNLELQNQNFELQSQFDQLIQLTKIRNSSIVVRVTDFTLPDFFSPMVGTWVESDANITVQNFGTNDLEGLTLTIDNPDDYPSGSVPQSLKIESLNAGEERTVTTNVYWELGEGIKFVIRIKLDDMILHEYRTY
jgi:TolA-binding protein